MNATSTPSPFTATTVAPYLSARYVRVDTSAVIAALADEGYTVAATRRDNSRLRNPMWARHEVDFRHPDMGGTMPDGTTPRVLFINSHNGTTRAQFLLGAFRMVCSNGMIVGSTWARERVQHVGENARQVVERIRQASKNTGPMFQQIEQWSKVSMTRSKQLDFAKAALDIRFGDGARDRYDPSDLLLPVRHEDEGADLWRVFNRVQEHGTRTPLLGHTTGGRTVRSRGIGSIGVDHNWNTKLWALAEAVAA